MRLTMFRFPMLLGCVLVSALGACSMWQPKPPAVAASLASAQTVMGVEWVAAAIDGVQPLTQPLPHIRWTSAQQIEGLGGCNVFVGEASIQADGALQFEKLAATGRACLSAPTGQEDMFFKALEQTQQARMVAGELVLQDGAGKVLARFTKGR